MPCVLAFGCGLNEDARAARIIHVGLSHERTPLVHDGWIHQRLVMVSALDRKHPPKPPLSTGGEGIGVSLRVTTQPDTFKTTTMVEATR
jgi:hypothetical protein